MSTHDVAALDHALNQRILAGDILGAFEEFYAEEVTMQENNAEPFVGKALNREREQKFVDSIAEVHGMSMPGSAVNGDRSYSEWMMELTFRGGPRVKMEQVAARQWKDGKIIHERFYYKG